MPTRAPARSQSRPALAPAHSMHTNAAYPLHCAGLLLQSPHGFLIDRTTTLPVSACSSGTARTSTGTAAARHLWATEDSERMAFAHCTTGTRTIQASALTRTEAASAVGWRQGWPARHAPGTWSQACRSPSLRPRYLRRGHLPRSHRARLLHPRTTSTYWNETRAILSAKRSPTRDLQQQQHQLRDIGQAAGGGAPLLEASPSTT